MLNNVYQIMFEDGSLLRLDLILQYHDVLTLLQFFRLLKMPSMETKVDILQNTYAHVLSLHDLVQQKLLLNDPRSEEHTSELQSRGHLVCRLLLEKKKTNTS